MGMLYQLYFKKNIINFSEKPKNVDYLIVGGGLGGVYSDWRLTLFWSLFINFGGRGQIIGRHVI